MRQTPTKRRAPRFKVTPLPPLEILRLLQDAYGPTEWRPRLDGVSELVWTVLSQHTADTNAERAYLRLRAAFTSWEAVMAAPTTEVIEAIAVAGLGNMKAPRIQAVLRRIAELRGELRIDFLKDLPLADAKAWLRRLPGVGPKTAAVTLCFSLGMPAMAVDTHVYRVSRRLGLIGPKTTVEQAHDVLEAAVPPERVYDFHVALISHGRQTCKAPTPRCGACVLRDSCPTALMYLEGAPKTKS